MKKVVCTFLLISLTMTLFAQKRFDVFYVAGNFNFMQKTEVNTSNYLETAITANISLPIVLKDSSIWFTSVDYQYFSIPNEYKLNSNILEEFNLHGFIIRTGYIKRLSSTESLHLLFAPRIMTDFNASFSKSIQPGGVIMYERKKSDDLTWRAGVMYNQDFFGPYMLPVVYLDWNISGIFKLTGLLPVYGKLYVQPSEKLSTGLHFIGLTTSFRIDEMSYENFYVDRRSIDLSLFVNRHLWSNFFFEGRLGYALTRDYGLFSENDKMTIGLPLLNIGDNRERFNNEYSGSPFIHTRIVYGLPLK